MIRVVTRLHPKRSAKWPNVYSLMFLHEGFASQILAPSFDGQPCPPLPVDGLLYVGFEISVGRLAQGHRARARGFDFDQRFFHLLNDEPDHFLGVFGLLQHRVDVGLNDVSKSGKDSHGISVFGIRRVNPHRRCKHLTAYPNN
jgi:hypothetical protein